MGQQQLLLLVIGVVIVGFATMAAFFILENSFKKDEADGLLDRTLAISTQAVSWKSRNDPFAGGNQSYMRLTGEGVDAMEMLSLIDSNVRGTYRIIVVNDETIHVVGVSERYEGIGVCTLVEGYNIRRSIVRFDDSISGLGEGDNCTALLAESE